VSTCGKLNGAKNCEPLRREGGRGKKGEGETHMTIGINDQTYLRRVGWDLPASLDEICVDDRVKEMVINGVVDVGILVIVTPA